MTMRPLQRGGILSLAVAADCSAAAALRMRPAREPGAGRAFALSPVRMQAGGEGGGGQFAFACGLALTQVFAIGMN